MDDPVITVDEVTKQFRDGTTTLDRLSLAIPRGVIYGLLGPNGADGSLRPSSPAAPWLTWSATH